MTQCRLIYNSIPSDQIMNNEDLRAMVEQCAQNNSRVHITGMLILSGHHFLQVLEGPSDAVNRLFTKIMRDKRHHDIHLVSYEPIGPSYFDNWSMHLVDLYDLPIQARWFLVEKYGHQDGVIQIPEKLHLVYSLLLDAKSLCLSKPWDDHSKAS